MSTQVSRGGAVKLKLNRKSAQNGLNLQINMAKKLFVVVKWEGAHKKQNKYLEGPA